MNAHNPVKDDVMFLRPYNKQKSGCLQLFLTRQRYVLSTGNNTFYPFLSTLCCLPYLLIDIELFKKTLLCKLEITE